MEFHAPDDFVVNEQTQKSFKDLVNEKIKFMPRGKVISALLNFSVIILQPCSFISHIIPSYPNLMILRV